VLALIPAITLDISRQADGRSFALVRRGEEWCVRVDGTVLMSNRSHVSEMALAQHALERTKNVRRVLVGGLGLGFTLRAVLDLIPRAACVTVCELVPAVAEWNQKHVGHLARHPLSDPRTTLELGDVSDVIQRASHEFDAILLDVDNGPVAASSTGNHRLYSARGASACMRALRPRGVLAVWSRDRDERFARVLTVAGFGLEVLRVPANRRGRARHAIFLATAPERPR
jgi:spermidine synthase